MPDIVTVTEHKMTINAHSRGQMGIVGRDSVDRLELDPYGAKVLAETVLKLGPPVAIFVHETGKGERDVKLSFAFKMPESPGESSG